MEVLSLEEAGKARISLSAIKIDVDVRLLLPPLLVVALTLEAGVEH